MNYLIEGEKINYNNQYQQTVTTTKNLVKKHQRIISSDVIFEIANAWGSFFSKWNLIIHIHPTMNSLHINENIA